ncbi:hypothetical protein [Lichenicoccus sp.]|uniref:hypothetical protein n=1 Tax=Lichenicoccus sp. TaxID=2781899 RepID=UPI003D13B27A
MWPLIRRRFWQASAATFSLLDEAGVAVLVDPSGRHRRLRRQGGDFPALREGWTATGFHLALPPLVVIALRHQGGDTAHWIVDAADEAYFEQVVHLPTPIRDTLLSGAHGLERAVWGGLPRTLRLELLAAQPRKAGLGAGERLAVQTADNVVAVELADGSELPILIGAKAMRPADLQAGWTAQSLYRDFDPFYLLELRHADGARATWLLDAELRLIDDLTHGPGAIRDMVMPYALPVMNRHLDTVLAFKATEDALVTRYLDLVPSARSALLGHCNCDIRPALTPLGASTMAASMAVPGDIILDRETVERAVSVDLHQRTLAAIRDGGLDWPSPIDGSETRLRGIFILDDYVFIYQFTDRNGIDFLAVAGDRSARLIGLVIPAANLFLFDDRTGLWMGDTWLRNERGLAFWPLLVRHINQYSELMGQRRRSGEARGINVLLSVIHIGHHLWNDLTGLEALCRAVPEERLPTTLILGSQNRDADDGHAELFGPLEALFPPLAGRVDRTLASVDAFIYRTYGEDVWPCRITRDHVSADLRARVTAHLGGSEEARAVDDFFAERPRAVMRPPVVIFGLRVEDRTFVDLPGFCDAFTTFMAERHPGAVIVFDGYNRGPAAGEAGVIRGMAYGLARRPPEDVEREIVAGIAAKFAQAPVTIIGTTGESIATSLAWCRQADAAFAIWGAGLAKYRWLANLPTMMISTRANLLGRPDLAIYQDPRFTEAPAPHRFADAAWVTDAGAQGRLASGHIQGNRECFNADTAAVLAAFDDFLASLR